MSKWGTHTLCTRTYHSGDADLLGGSGTRERRIASPATATRFVHSCPRLDISLCVGVFAGGLCVCLCVFVCVYVCVVRENVCVCVCVYVCTEGLGVERGIVEHTCIDPGRNRELHTGNTGHTSQVRISLPLLLPPPSHLLECIT
jgi:hypothetical protein